MIHQLNRPPDYAQTPQSNQPLKLVDCNVVAKHLGVTGRYVLQMASEGRIPCFRIGKRCVRFDEKDVLNAIQSMREFSKQ